jgi:hypothetical protein
MNGIRVLPGPALVRAIRTPAATVLLLGAGGTALVVALTVAAARAGLPQDVTLPDWWGAWPTGDRARPGWAVVTTAVIGVLCAAWALVGSAWLPRGATVPRARSVALAAFAWAIPLLPTGPIGSLDVQSYAAVGRLAALGLDPYRFGPGWLSGAYAHAVSPVWLWTPTPYGPIQVAALRGIAIVAGNHVGLAVLTIRALAIVGLAVAVAVAVHVAASRERTAVLLLVALNPLVLVHVVSGAHLDVFVGALAVVVVLLTRTEHPVAAMVGAIVAMQIKLPGAVLAAYVALDVYRRNAQPERRAALARVLGAGALTAAATAVAFPDAFGWLRSLGVPGTIRSAVAPSTWVSYLLAGMTGQLDAGGLAAATTVGRVLTLLAGAVLVVRLLWRATAGPERAAYRDVGWALVVVALAGPVTYPWYLTWGLFAAAVGSGPRGRLALLGMSAALVLVSGSPGGAAGAAVVAAGLAAVGFALWRTRDVLVGTTKAPELGAVVTV